MKNKEIVKEIKGMQARLDMLVKEIKQKPVGGKWAEIEQPKLTLGGHEVTVSENGKIIYFGGGFLYIETAHNIVTSSIEAFRIAGQPDVSFQVDELKELLTKIEEV